jgi:hypothetical protein
MTAVATSYELLLKVRKGAVDIVDVPEFGFVAVTGTGEPGGAEFTEAVQALYRVSSGQDGIASDRHPVAAAEERDVTWRVTRCGDGLPVRQARNAGTGAERPRCLPGWSETGSPRPSGVAAAAAAGR